MERFLLIIVLCFIVVGCTMQAEVSSIPSPLTPKNIPASIAIVEPDYYSRFIYSKRLKRRVKEIIPAKELTPINREEEKEIKKEQNAIDEAVSVLDKLRQQTINPPVLRQ